MIIWNRKITKGTQNEIYIHLCPIDNKGAQAGTVVCLPICGLLADHVGWESIFYVWGAAGCIWFVLWYFLVFSSPEDHPRISTEEKEYIISNIYEQGTDSQNNAMDGKLPIPPYKQIFTSIPLVATIITAMCQNYGFYTVLTMTPTYLNNIQHFSLESVSNDLERNW